jgi:hypothetical protein
MCRMLAAAGSIQIITNAPTTVPKASKRLVT